MAKLFSAKNSDQIWEMLSNGNETEILDYLSRIEYHPKQVILFEKVYDEHMEALTINDWSGSYPEQEEFTSDISESVGELLDFIRDMPPERNFGLFLTFLNHGAGEVTVEFGWVDGGRGSLGSGPVIWDRWQGTVSSPIIAFGDIAHTFSIKDYQCMQKPKEYADPPMYRYHPERFRAFRSYAEKLGGIYQREAQPRSGLIGLEILQKIGNLAMHEMNDKAMKYPRRFKDDLPSPSFIMDVEPSLAMAYGRFVQAGKQIIDFPLELTEMLRNTDVENIPMKSVKLPFASQYLYFGPQADLEMSPGWLVDGVYVESRGEEGDMRFSVTTVPVDHSLSNLWHVLPEAYYSQDFIEKYREEDLAHAIDGVLSETLESLKTTQLKQGGDITDLMHQMSALEGRPLDIPKSLSVVDVSPKNAATRLGVAIRQHPVYRAAMRLAVNGLCYLTAYPDDISLAWPDGTPRGLREKADSPDPKTASKAKSKLASMGYTPIHICGKRVMEQRESAGVASGHHVSAHWRRGHWRNQAYGTGYSMRKLIWVMPTLIAAGHEETEVSGHLYLVS